MCFVSVRDPKYVFFKNLKPFNSFCSYFNEAKTVLGNSEEGFYNIGRFYDRIVGKVSITSIFYSRFFFQYLFAKKSQS